MIKTEQGSASACRQGTLPSTACHCGLREARDRVATAVGSSVRRRHVRWFLRDGRRTAASRSIRFSGCSSPSPEADRSKGQVLKTVSFPGNRGGADYGPAGTGTATTAAPLEHRGTGAHGAAPADRGTASGTRRSLGFPGAPGSRVERWSVQDAEPTDTTVRGNPRPPSSADAAVQGTRDGPERRDTSAPALFRAA
jgi:hypothetical protein